MPRGILFDVDGTLVDTNYLHVVAWSRALRANGHPVPMRKLHETVGQGAERFVETVTPTTTSPTRTPISTGRSCTS